MRLGTLLMAALLLLLPITGCIGASDDALNTSSTDDPAEAAEAAGIIDTDLLEGMVEVSTATPVVSSNVNPASGESFAFELPTAANATGWVLELVWDPSTPASEQLDLWVREAGAGNVPPEDPTSPQPPAPVADGTGTSPLKVTLAPQDLEDGVTYEVLIRAPSDTAVGAAVDQPFELHVSQFVDRPFDQDYSALEDDTTA